MSAKECKFRDWWGKALTALMAFLGFSGCANVTNGITNEPVVCMYGVPSAEFRISGKVTDENQKQPIEDVQISIGRSGNYFSETFTNKNGEYQINDMGFPIDSIEVEAIDTNGIYESQTVKIKAEYKGGDNAWNRGTTTAKVDFVLTKKAGNDD